VLECRGTGGFVSVADWNYFDSVVGSYRERRKGNTSNAVRLWEYEGILTGETRIINGVYVYHSKLGWKIGIDGSMTDVSEFKAIAERNIGVAYPVYHACLRIENMNQERDLLTGVYNRGKFFADMKGNVLTSLKMHINMWLLYIDLNNFKVVNDFFGHETGDRVLRSISQEIRAVIAGYGTVYRLGGDEFAAIIIGVDEQKLNELVKRVEMTSEQAPCGVYVNASVGVKKYNQEYGQGDKAIEMIMKEADREMYDIKTHKKQVCIVCEKCQYREKGIIQVYA
jgi:diguanylate cyclase (GGDEF)-like protein